MGGDGFSYILVLNRPQSLRGLLLSLRVCQEAPLAHRGLCRMTCTPIWSLQGFGSCLSYKFPVTPHEAEDNVPQHYSCSFCASSFSECFQPLWLPSAWELERMTVPFLPSTPSIYFFKLYSSPGSRWPQVMSHNGSWDEQLDYPWHNKERSPSHTQWASSAYCSWWLLLN